MQNVDAGCNDSTADIVFVLDASGSISREDFEQIKHLVGAVVQSLTIRTDLTPNGFQVALISFADDTDVRFYLNTYTDKELMLAAINVPYTRGRTNLDQALRYTTHTTVSFAGYRVYGSRHLVKATEVTAGRTGSNGGIPLGGWLISEAIRIYVPYNTVYVKSSRFTSISQRIYTVKNIRISADTLWRVCGPLGFIIPSIYGYERIYGTGSVKIC